MTDCSDLGNCLIPMWVQYLIVLFAVGMLLFKCSIKPDPYDRM